MTGVYKIAGKNIRVSSIHDDIHELCKNYFSESKPDFSVEIFQSDIDFEREKSCGENYSDGYLEELAVYRKISEKMPEHNIFLFHGSAVSVDGAAYIFTAPSGTGKSTHALLWCKLLGNRAVMVNDDKPMIKILDGKAIVFGTPFNGKHKRGNNIFAPVKAICILERSNVNSIHEITSKEAYPKILRQVYRPADKIAMIKTLGLLDKFLECVKIFRLSCDISLDAAKISFEAMTS